MAEYSANALQTVNPGETVIFTSAPAPCERGLVRWREETGNFQLRGYVPNNCGCCCRRKQSANYLIDFGANIAVPEGGSVDYSANLMGSEFWWFYDVVAAAAVLICVFLAGKKGGAKAALGLGTSVLAVVISLAVSGSIATSLYKGTIRGSNIKKLEKSMEYDAFVEGMRSQMESFGYAINVDPEQLRKIFADAEDVDAALYKYANNINGRVVDTQEGFNENIHEAYGEVISNIISDNLSKYAAGMAKEKIAKKPSTINQLAPMMVAENSRRAAGYIADNYIADAYKSVIRLIALVLMMLLIMFIGYILIRSYTDGDHSTIVSHIVGGFLGIGIGGVFAFMIAVIIRLYVILGSNEMMFFNFEAIDKTYLFRHIYSLVLKL